LEDGKGASVRDLEKNHNDTPACGWMDPYTHFILFYESLALPSGKHIWAIFIMGVLFLLLFPPFFDFTDRAV